MRLLVPILAVFAAPAQIGIDVDTAAIQPSRAVPRIRVFR